MNAKKLNSIIRESIEDEIERNPHGNEALFKGQMQIWIRNDKDCASAINSVARSLRRRNIEPSFQRLADSEVVAKIARRVAKLHRDSEETQSVEIGREAMRYLKKLVAEEIMEDMEDF